MSTTTSAPSGIDGDTRNQERVVKNATETPLINKDMFKLAATGDTDQLKTLLAETGQDINSADGTQCTPLAWAARNGASMPARIPRLASRGAKQTRRGTSFDAGPSPRSSRRPFGHCAVDH